MPENQLFLNQTETEFLEDFKICLINIVQKSYQTIQFSDMIEWNDQQKKNVVIVVDNLSYF